jgi:hypothetical protein
MTRANVLLKISHAQPPHGADPRRERIGKINFERPMIPFRSASASVARTERGRAAQLFE